MESFLKQDYIQPTSSGDGGDAESDLSPANTPSKAKRRGTLAKPIRVQKYVEFFAELQGLRSTHERLYFKAMYPPGLKIRISEELSSEEIGLIDDGAVFEVSEIGVSKKGIPRVKLAGERGGWTSYIMSDTCALVLQDVSAEEAAKRPVVGSVQVDLPPGTTVYGEQLSVADYVTDFYSRYNPSKLDEVPHILEKYKDREEVLLAKLGKQYGVESPGKGPTNPKLDKLLAKLEKKIPDSVVNELTSPSEAARGGASRFG
jgi:hypothetical protein